MLTDELFAKSGGNFPYRRYIFGTSSNIDKLRTLLTEYQPEYDQDGFDQADLENKGKVQSRLTGGESIFDLFEKGPKNIGRQPQNWDLDSVIDQYTETARMSSPGYGRTHTPLGLWFKTSFSKLRDQILKGKRTLYEAREAIHKAGEVRPAYVTDSIGLYQHLRDTLLRSSNAPIVVDITAFGDRLVAAAATGYEYIGIDPDPNLVDGISRLTMDVKAIVPEAMINTYSTPLEHFMPEVKVDLVTFSPPPYDAEPYTGGDRQVHKVYRDFRHWFHGFIREALTRASYWLREGGVLGFSVLDRPTIVYTEAMILLAANLGFRPVEIFSLSGGTPWWIFVKDSQYYNDLFLKIYPDLNLNYLYKTNTPHMEYIRMNLMDYLVEICIRHQVFIDPTKTRDHLGRVLMSKLPLSDDEDPVFPDSLSDVVIDDSLLNKNIRYPIIIQTPDAGYRMVVGSRDHVLLDIFTVVIRYLHWVQCTTEYELFTKLVKVVQNKDYVSLQTGHQNVESVIGFLRKRTFFTEKSFENIRVTPKTVSLWSSKHSGVSPDNVSSYLRYATVGVLTHHWTRPLSRIDAIAKIVGVESRNNVVDLFATPFNANSKLYCSVYPDVDPGSLGNFFMYSGGPHKVFMANPPPYKGFKEPMIERLFDVYLLDYPDRIIFFSTTVWEADAKKQLEAVRKGQPVTFNDWDNYYELTYIFQKHKDLVKGVYLLDYDRYPPLDMAEQKTRKRRENTESFGVILTQKDLNLSELSLLSNGKHVIY